MAFPSYKLPGSLKIATKEKIQKMEAGELPPSTKKVSVRSLYPTNTGKKVSGKQGLGF